MRLKQLNAFKPLDRTMDNFDLSNPTFLTSLVIGAVILAAASGAFQMYTGEEGEGVGAVKSKAVIRDGILGAIFTAMAWTLVPDSMKHVSESLTSTITSAASAATPVSSDFDLQIGPPRF